VVVEPTEIDLPTLSALAGGGVVRWILGQLVDEGHEGVKPSHGYVIQRLVDGEPTIGALADALGMTQQGASKQVKDLERLGYAERVPVPGDQRARRVRLTPTGRAVLESARRARARLEDELTDRVGADAVTTTRQTMAALLDVLGLDERVRTRTVPAPEE
jgi:DNA-binding MarR family transcriptional regulator